MKLSLATLAGCCALLTIVPALRADPEDSIVQVVANGWFPNPVRPWMKGDSFKNSGTGVVIDGNRILTNAHIVRYGVEITVQPRADGDKFEAKIAALNHDVDLAILTVKDDKLFQKRPPLPRWPNLPKAQNAVSVFGFPIGGTGLSITRGEVSRIDSQNYGYRGVGLVIQVSAAINPGNSGGPALVGDKMIGLVVSRAVNAQNIGYVIPNEEVEIFLEDLKDGRYDGKPMLAPGLLMYQRLENQVLRRKFKIDANVRGVMILPANLDPRSPLKAFDVLTAIGTHPIDNAGLVRLKNGLNSPFEYWIPRLTRGQELPATIWRQGQELKVSLPVTTQDNRVVRPYQGEPLAYFIHGPLVFAPGKTDDIQLYAKLNRNFFRDNSPLALREWDLVKYPGEELVVVSAPMFNHPIAKGFGDPVGKVVKDVNGVPIKNLRHLVETIRDCADDFLTFRFADEWSELLVFDRKEMHKATEDILDDHGIAVTRRGSPSLLKVWQAGGKGK